MGPAEDLVVNSLLHALRLPCMSLVITSIFLISTAHQERVEALATGASWETWYVLRQETSRLFWNVPRLTILLSRFALQYGWDASQNWPSLLSAYSRHMLGWVHVKDVTYSQTFTVTSSCDSDTVYKISHRCASDTAGEEYFLIEVRKYRLIHIRYLREGHPTTHFQKVVKSP